MAKVKRERCTICKKPVMVQIFKGTGLCSDLCRKDRDNDHEPASGTLDKRGKLIATPKKRDSFFQLGV